MARAKPNKDLRDLILGEARREMLAQGYRSLSMRKIASAIGCTATSIYLYFKDKDDLLHALIDEGLDRLHQQLTASTEGVKDPRRRCERLCRAFLNFAIDNREFYEVIFQLHPDHMKRYPQTLYRRARRNLDLFASTLAEAAGRSGKATDMDQLQAHVVWAQLHGAVALHQSQRLDFRINIFQFFDGVVKNALNAIPGHGDSSS